MVLLDTWECGVVKSAVLVLVLVLGIGAESQSV
jgi:hypothetical protein